MKFTNVASALALLSIGACVAYRTEAEIETAADVITKNLKDHKFNKDAPEVKALNLSEDEVKALCADDLAEDTIVQALKDVSQKEVDAMLNLLGSGQVQTISAETKEKLNKKQQEFLAGKKEDVEIDAALAAELLSLKEDTTPAETPTETPKAGGFTMIEMIGYSALALGAVAAIGGGIYYFTKKGEEPTDL